MALQTILNNIGSYLELLHTARTSDSIHWNEHSFKNAFKWAEYCHKIYTQSEGKPYKKQLDNEILKLADSFGRFHFGILKVELDLFKDSLELLTTALIFNQHFILDEDMLNAFNEYFDEDSIKKFRNINDKWRYLEQNIDDHQMATTALITVMLSFCSSHLYQSETIKLLFTDILTKLIQSKNGFMAFSEGTSAIFQVRKCTSNSKFIHTTEFIHNFLPVLYSVAHGFKDVFLNLCVKEEDIFRRFLEHLLKSGQTFKIIYNSKESGSRFLFEWRNDSDQGITYNTLLNWFDTFLNISTEVNIMILTSIALSEAANASDINVFKTVCQELNRIDLLDF